LLGRKSPSIFTYFSRQPFLRLSVGVIDTLNGLADLHITANLANVTTHNFRLIEKPFMLSTLSKNIKGKKMKIIGLIAFVLASSMGTSAHSQDRTIGDWISGRMESNEGVYAGTMNDSKGILGQYCFSNSGDCIWLLANKTNCEEGSEYSVLVNSEAGALSTRVYCFKNEGEPRFAFADFKSIDNAIRNASNIGIAFPLQSGTFKVSRFSLNGAAKALDHMRNAASKAVGKKATTRDQTL